MKIIIFLTVILVCAISDNDSANILAVFPMPSISHQIVFRKITQELSKRGHELTVITTDPAYPSGGGPSNYNEIDVHDESYGLLRNFMRNSFNITGEFIAFSEVRQIWILFTELLKIQFKRKAVQDLISKNKKYDLILIESFVRPALAYSHIFKAPVILISSFTAVFSNNKVLGSHTHPLLYPSFLSYRYYNLSFIEKFKMLYRHYLYEYAHYLNEKDENKILRDILGPQFPTLHEISNNVVMLLLNVHSIWADNQPVAPNVVYMGGIHQLPERKLPKDLQSYLDSSKNGVIYVSFGTNVLSDMIPHTKVLTIINVLSKLPYNILWKWDKDELPKKSRNIKTSKWFPQSDLLRHQNIKLFITQAGLQSTDEAITAGVPLVAIPMLGDQFYNAEKYEKFGIGAKLDIRTFTEKQLKESIVTVMKNESYRRNVIKLRGIMRDQPETPLNRTMWWIEYVIRHKGAKHLRSPASNMSYAEYFEIEIILVLLLAIVVFLIVIVLFFNFIAHQLLSSNKKSKLIKSPK